MKRYNISSLFVGMFLVLGSFLTSCTNDAIPNSKIEVLPRLNYQVTPLGGNVGIRPYREGGIRIETEEIGKKIFFHNYGHGGAGISLAPGSTKISVDQFINGSYKNNKNIAVLGSGIIGLLTAQLLKELGYNVIVYTEKLPQRDFLFKGTPCITSLAGGGYWMPFGMDPGKDQALMHNIQKISWDFYNELAAKNTNGIRLRNAFCFGIYTPYEKDSDLHQEVLKNVNLHTAFVRFEGSKKIIKCKKFQTFSIVNNIYLSDLYDTLKKSGVKFHKILFKNLPQILSLKEKIIFNCTGNGAKDLFGDSNMKAIRGQIMYLPQDTRHDTMFIFLKDPEIGRFSIYPMISKMGVGLTCEENENKFEILPQTFENYKRMLQQFYEKYAP